MKEYTLPRTGDTPVTFRGEVVATETGRDERQAEKKQFQRYHTLTLYKTAGGNYVVHIEYFSEWKEETRHSHVVIAKTPQELAEKLLDHNPTEYVIGWGPGDYYRDRQQKLLLSLETRYDAQVGRLLSCKEFAGKVAQRVE